jgi:predicted ATP-grasp superfamily ATP-dependent carboligase
VRVIPAAGYPHKLAAYLSEAPAGPWMFISGLENHPPLVAKLARQRPLWGNAGDVLKQIRDPAEVVRTLQNASLPCPEIRRQQSELAPTKRWLVKPLAGTGGTRIRLWDRTNPAADRREYFQEFIEGQPCSAILLGTTAGARLLGATEQLIGECWLRARPFGWCGNIGPMTLTDNLKNQLERLGELLVREFLLRGFFGVDFIMRDDEAWPVEVNPRYTAAVEVLEYADQAAFLNKYWKLFAGQTAHHRPLFPKRKGSKSLIGKAVLYAPRSLVFPVEGPWQEVLGCPPPITELPAFADIPAAGTRIEAGQPILTMFARGDTVKTCQQQLQKIAVELEQCLYR